MFHSLRVFDGVCCGCVAEEAEPGEEESDELDDDKEFDTGTEEDGGTGGPPSNTNTMRKV